MQKEKWGISYKNCKLHTLIKVKGPFPKLKTLTTSNQVCITQLLPVTFFFLSCSAGQQQMVLYV